MTDTHTHHNDDRELTETDKDRHRKALRIMVVVLIPLLIWTIAGLIFLWPRDVESKIDPSLANPPDITFVTGKVTNITEISCEGLPGSVTGGSTQVCADLAVELSEGPEQGQTVQIAVSDTIYKSGVSIGQKLKLMRVPAESGQPPAYQFSDFERTLPLAVFALIFAVLVVAVARWRGFASLIGLAFAGFILIKFMFPALVSGSNPILVGLIGSAAIMFVVLYAAHGFSARTTTALLGTLFGLVLSAFLGWMATEWAHLTGVSAEDDYVLAATAPNMQLTSVVICGIIIAGLGVLNDVTITQASAVWELADADPDRKRLFSRAMRIGRDHIASTVYTIAFATAGAVLPVLLLIVIYQRPLIDVVQTEQFAGEVIRTLIGSIGLILAVPLTTVIGVAVVRVSDRSGGAALAPAGSGTPASPAKPRASRATPFSARTGRSGRSAESPGTAARSAESPSAADPKTETTRAVRSAPSAPGRRADRGAGASRAARKESQTGREEPQSGRTAPSASEPEVESTMTQTAIGRLFRRGDTDHGRSRRAREAKEEAEFGDFSHLRESDDDTQGGGSKR
ncbi:YibE/F family protein [Microlunatus speluncae]|uniref:YibE/F family protein n=1 Tax=Microlunatus speluncae TaxID=2594267 RepID=UPI001FE77E7B|nr:YibE/F family protein [Microlunatus speluncae]